VALYCPLFDKLKELAGMTAFRKGFSLFGYCPN